jgi:predicted porin
MKHSILFGLALTSISSTIYAQSVTLYGVIDTGVEFVDHVGAGSNTLARMPANTGLIPSRWGLRGIEPLGSDLNVVFTLENGFNTRGGDIVQGGRLFGRQSWVGLSGSWGTLSFGRQYTMTTYALTDSEISGPSVYGIGSFDNYLPNARADNSVAYKGHFGPFTLGAMYSSGRDSAGTGNSRAISSSAGISRRCCVMTPRTSAQQLPMKNRAAAKMRRSAFSMVSRPYLLDATARTYGRRSTPM